MSKLFVEIEGFCIQEGWKFAEVEPGLERAASSPMLGWSGADPSPCPLAEAARAGRVHRAHGLYHRLVE